MKTPEYERRLAAYENEVSLLQLQLKSMEEEVINLRRQLSDTPRQVRRLERQLSDAKSRLEQATTQNDKLAYTLGEARDHIASLRDEVDKLTQPPAPYGTFLSLNTEDDTADIYTSGRKMRVTVAPGVDVSELETGAEVVLNDSLSIVKISGQERSGEVAIFKELLADGHRAIILGRGDEQRVAELASWLPGEILRTGDHVLIDPASSMMLEKLPRPEVEELVLEEVPDVTYEDIGGLSEQIGQIVDAVELPFLHAKLFAEYELPAPKGILLYGPPGCGKTLIAKAVANSLAKRVAEVSGDSEARSYFLNIKGPELLNKYVGETERQIRLIFERAREKSDEGWPVIIFFDEMESLFRMRGSGISSDMESTIVPQLLAEIDGVESLKNTIVIGASNREDLIDPAILRPGRLDVKIKIERPGEEAARSIFSRYLTSSLPLSQKATSEYSHREDAVSAMIDETVEFMYRTDDETRFLEVTYQNGETEILYFRDFSSGAMIENIVRRAKKLAIKRLLDSGEEGIRVSDLTESVTQEFAEQEDLPNTTNPDDWAKISGKKGQRITFVRTLVKKDDDRSSGGRSIDSVATGQYL